MRKKRKVKMEGGRNVILSIILGYCGNCLYEIRDNYIKTLQSILFLFLQNKEDLQ